MKASPLEVSALDIRASSGFSRQYWESIALTVSDVLKDDLLDNALDQLDDERTLGIALLAFARTVIDRPENNRKIDGSYSGHAMALLTHLALRELRMWCSRVWEIPMKGNPVHSLPMVAKSLQGRHLEIFNARLRAHPDWPRHFLGEDTLEPSLAAFVISVEDMKNSNLLNQLRLVRHEHFAHLVKGRSRFRSKLDTSMIESSYTWNDVLNLTERSIALIADATLIWKFHSHDSHATLDKLSKYYENFWRYMPNLSEMEEQDRLDKIQKKETMKRE